MLGTGPPNLLATGCCCTSTSHPTPARSQVLVWPMQGSSQPTCQWSALLPEVARRWGIILFRPGWTPLGVLAIPFPPVLEECHRVAQALSCDWPGWLAMAHPHLAPLATLAAGQATSPVGDGRVETSVLMIFKFLKTIKKINKY